jgi:hypothetical protein
VRCGSEGPFSSSRAFLCNRCRTHQRKEERKKANHYFQARNRAMKRLREEYPDRWEELLEDEWRKAQRKMRLAVVS